MIQDETAGRRQSCLSTTLEPKVHEARRSHSYRALGPDLNPPPFLILLIITLGQAERGDQPLFVQNDNGEMAGSVLSQLKAGGLAAPGPSPYPLPRCPNDTS